MPKKASIWMVTYSENGQTISQTQTKGEAFRIARAKAKELYTKYKSMRVRRPVERKNANGSVTFYVPGIVESMCPRVEEIG